ncbi:hypothetical protein BDF22DRAFT_696363 [Syncephalis plumigaleata]|nr:hypothetical protein BDF22DRAFT_696363 [Syncephalis plumigaleata]
MNGLKYTLAGRIRPTPLARITTRSMSMAAIGLRGWSPASAKGLDGNRNMSSGIPSYSGGGGGVSNDVFWRSQRRSLPVNTIIKFVPQQEAWIVERMGRFNRVLEPGLAILIPIIDQIKYVKSLKEVAIEIPSQSAITQDNVTLQLDGVLYIRIVDPFKACYGVEDAEYSVAQLAQTTMRAEIGQMTLDRTLAERNQLNQNIVQAINHAAEDWGIRCLRYEIRDIHPPVNVVESMHSQVSAERSKRAQILESEGSRQAAINVAEGHKQSTILASEADKAEQINRASARGIEETPGGRDAVSLTVAEKYVDAFGQIAQKGTTVVVPANTTNISGMVAQALTIYDTINKKREESGASAVVEQSEHGNNAIQ